MRPDDDKGIDNQECSIPIAIPPTEIKRYSPIRDPDAEQDVARYVEYEAREHVHHVELIKTEYVAGDQYDVWDVITESDRWWVITNITNLYSQKIFPSLDYNFSFHIGLMLRMASRPHQVAAREPHPLESAFRQLEQISNALDRASEMQEYQAIGMQLRECLLSTIPAMKSVCHPVGESPKNADFKAWAEVAIGSVYPGAAFKELRSLLKAIADKLWIYVNWLTHYRSACQSEAVIGYQETGTFVGHLAQLLSDHKKVEEMTCPHCGSRQIRSHYDVRLQSGQESYLTCAACSWTNHPDGEERSFETSALDLLQRDGDR